MPHAADARRRPGHERGSWSDWKEIARLAALSRHLAISVRPGSVLRADEDRARTIADAGDATSSAPDFAEEIEAHFEFMPDNYFRAFEVDGDRFAPEACSGVFWKICICATGRRWPRRSHGRRFPEQGHSIASFCAWDRQELLAKIAGSFAVVPINILSADIYTRGDNVVLDIFRVCDTEISRRDRQARPGAGGNNLARARWRTRLSISRRCSIRRAAKSVKRASRRKWISRRASPSKTRRIPTYTLIQIQTPDRLGLLYELLSRLRTRNASRSRSRASAPKRARPSTRSMSPIARPAEKSPIPPGSRVAGTTAPGGVRERRARARRKSR